MYSRFEEAFAALEALIEKRQAFEAANPREPYTLFPTTYDYYDQSGETLLLLAIKMGDLAKVQHCIAKGANVNCCSLGGLFPMQLAIQWGRLAISQYLMAQGANCFNVDTQYCQDPSTKQWFLSELRTVVDRDLAEPDEPPTPSAGNHIVIRRKRYGNWKNFNWKTKHAFSRPGEKCISLISRLIELGDVERMTEVIAQEYYRDIQAERLFDAIRFRQFSILHRLLAFKIPLDPVTPFTDGALHKAVQTGSVDMVAIFVEKRSDVNAPGNNKKTPLMYAISQRRLDLVKLLLTKEINFGLDDVDDDNVFHYAARCGDPAIWDYLSAYPIAQHLIKKANIYGETPEDILAGKNSERLPLDQGGVIDNFRYYLVSQYRSLEFFSKNGSCNGFVFLQAIHMEDYFLDTMAMLQAWDGTEKALDQPFLPSQPQSRFYRNLRGLFEGWIHDTIALQSGLVSLKVVKKRNERDKQWDLIRPNSERMPVIVFNEDEFTKQQRTPDQLRELLFYLSRMPIGTRFEIANHVHVLNARVTAAKGTLVTYDPNYYYRTKPEKSHDEVFQRIIANLYISIGEYNNFSAMLLIYYFQDKQNIIQFENFWIFPEDELPRSERDAKIFQYASPHGFTHLHLAVMTRSLPVIRKLLADGYCDVNTKDKLGRTVFDMMKNDLHDDVLQLFIDSPNVANLNELFSFVVMSGNLAIVKKLHASGKVNVNELIDDTGLPIPSIVWAMSQDDKALVKSLCELGAEVTHQTKFCHSAIHFATNNQKEFFPMLLPYVDEKTFEQLLSTLPSQLPEFAPLLEEEKQKRARKLFAFMQAPTSMSSLATVVTPPLPKA